MNNILDTDALAAPTSAPTPDRATHGERYTVVDSLVSELWNVTLRREYRTPGEKKRAIRAAIENELTQPIASSEAAHGEQDLPPLPDGYQVSEFIPGLWGWSMQVGLGKWENDGTMYGSQAAAVVAVWRNLADSLADELNSQPAAAPGAVDDAMVERGMDGAYRWATTHADYQGPEQHDWRDVQDAEGLEEIANLRAVVTAALTAALATKPDGQGFIDTNGT